MTRRIKQAIIGSWILAAIMCVAMVGGAYMNDRLIAEAPVRSLARVTSVGTLRTAIDFQDVHGSLQSPERGLLYPTGLNEGQRVWVTYNAARPDVVKVDGRQWTLAFRPALSILAVASAVAGVLFGLVTEISRRRSAAQSRNQNVTNI